MFSDDHRHRLALFNEKATMLLGSSFIATMFGQPTSVRISAEEVGGPVNVESVGPVEESVAAFVPTMRFFLQDQDNI